MLNENQHTEFKSSFSDAVIETLVAPQMQNTAIGNCWYWHQPSLAADHGVGFRVGCGRH